MTGSLKVVATAAPLLLEDLGRPGFAGIGVPVSGAFDRAAAALAQRLVGNATTEASLETMLGNVTLHVDTAVTAAVTGAANQITVNGTPISVNEVFSWGAGQLLHIGTARIGLRNYLAVRGGYAAEGVLGSASCDILSGLGPSPLSAGDAIGLAQRPAAHPQVNFAPVVMRRPGTLRVLLGPRHSWFSASSVVSLSAATYTVAADSNRVGIRLHGAPLQWEHPGELPSEPLQRGGLQVPPSGQPIIMGPDHPTTGGYPVVAAVVADDWDLCAQLRPGDEVEFVVIRR